MLASACTRPEEESDIGVAAGQLISQDQSASSEQGDSCQDAPAAREAATMSCGAMPAAAIERHADRSNAPAPTRHKRKIERRMSNREEPDR
jgi:hypothetical protein